MVEEFEIGTEYNLDKKRKGLVIRNIEKEEGFTANQTNYLLLPDPLIRLRHCHS